MAVTSRLAFFQGNQWQSPHRIDKYGHRAPLTAGCLSQEFLWNYLNGLGNLAPCSQCVCFYLIFVSTAVWNRANVIIKQDAGAQYTASESGSVITRRDGNWAPQHYFSSLWMVVTFWPLLCWSLPLGIVFVAFAQRLIRYISNQADSSKHPCSVCTGEGTVEVLLLSLRW